jgi:hypothetical protein
MIPHNTRAVVLDHDTALDALTVKLYRTTDGRRRAALTRNVAAARASLKHVVGAHVIAPGDLRR